jgi:hypothetical protein
VKKKLSKFIIFAPSYSPTSGGIVALHKLCDLLNQYGYQAVLYPAFKTHITHQGNWLKSTLSILYASFKFKYLRPYKTNTTWNTPVYKDMSSPIPDDWVVIYSEGVAYNPLKAKNVVRWLLHQPGYNYGYTAFGNSELIVTYSGSYLRNFQLPLSKIAKTKLYIPPVNLSFYLSDNNLPYEKREGVAYCLRKGRDKLLVHDASNSILVDGLPHEEMAEIFKSVKTFISYDSKTALSVFAAVAGADSIVIPDPGVDLLAWEPEERNRYGVAYGFENTEWARKTRPLLLKAIQDDIAQTEKSIHLFVSEVNECFPFPKYR